MEIKYIKKKFITWLNTRKIRFLLIGVLNTIISYLITIVFYYFLHFYMKTIVIAILINIFAISISFTTQKIFVFQKKGNWLKEYLRSWVIYSGSAIFNILGLWLFVDLFQISISSAFLIITAFVFIFTYLGHAKFTFKV